MSYFKKLFKDKDYPKKKVKIKSPSIIESMYYNAETIKFQDQIDNLESIYSVHAIQYHKVSQKTGVPVEVIVAIHSLESSLSFSKVLHNGEKLSDVNRYGTRWVPKGRGKGLAWNWIDAAIDALLMKERYFPKDWDIPNTLDFLERYNGLGYRLYHKDVNTPYLWSGTQYYKKGKYVSDGKFDQNATSKQVGCVPILRHLGYA